MSDQEVIERLANKLAEANLNDEEAAVLLSLLQGSGAEVEGFAHRPGGVVDPMEGASNLLDMTRSASGWIGVLSMHKPGGGASG